MKRKKHKENQIVLIYILFKETLLSYINKLEDFWIWNKSYIHYIPPEDYTNDLFNNRHQTAFTLGFDLSKNRNQGRREVIYHPCKNPELELTYTTEKDEYIKANRKEIYDRNGNRHMVPFNTSICIKHHYNSQCHESQIRGVYKDYIKDEKICKDLARINKVVAFSRHPKTDIIVIDIDCHSPEDTIQADKAFSFIKKHYFHNIIYSEISVNGGYHIFIKLGEKVNNEKLKRFQKYFNNLGFSNVDIIGGNNPKQLLQYIDSPTYLPFKVLRNGFIKPLTEKQYTESIKNFKLDSKIQTFDDLINVYKSIDMQYKEHEEIQKQPDTYVPIFTNRESSKAYRPSIQIVEELKSKYPYSAGERVDYMKKLATICKNYGLNEDQYIDIILNNDHGSKDLAKWDMQKINEIYSAYYKNERYYTRPFEFKHKEDKFYSNQYLIDENQYLKIYLNHLSDQFTGQYIKRLKYKKWTDEYKRIIPLLIKEIIGTVIYDTKNKKQKNPQSKLSMDKFNQLLKGTQITSKQLSLFKKHYNCKIDVVKLTNEILKNTLFKQFMVNNIGYCFNSKYKFSRIWIIKVKQYNEIIKDIIKNILKYLNDLRDNIQIHSIMQEVYDAFFGLRPDGTSKFFRGLENST